MRTLDEIQAQQGYVVMAWFGHLKTGAKILEGQWACDLAGNPGDVPLMVVGETDLLEWNRQNDEDGIPPLGPISRYREPGWRFYRVIAE
jgi:hypothetical protein